MNKTVVKVVKSVRFNAWDASGNKYTARSPPAPERRHMPMVMPSNKG